VEQHQREENDNNDYIASADDRKDAAKNLRNRNHHFLLSFPK
jgi:hypothetical protein